MITCRDKKVLLWLEKYHAITIGQAESMFYKNYDVARKRLKYLEECQHCQDYKDKYSNNKVYYSDRKVSSHDLLEYDFIKYIYNHGGTLNKFIPQRRFLNGQIVCDAYVEFIYKDNLYFVLLEVDYTHFTSISKIASYDKLYKSGQLQKECYGTFPILIISKPIVTTKTSNFNFDTLYCSLDYHELDFLLL